MRRTGAAARAMDVEHQRAGGLFEQPPQLALIPIDPAVEIASDGKSRGRIRTLPQKPVAGREPREVRERVSIQRSAWSDRRVIGKQREGVLLDQNRRIHDARSLLIRARLNQSAFTRQGF